MKTGGKGGEHVFLVERIRRGDHHGIERERQKILEAGVAGHAIVLGDEGAGHGRGIEAADELETVSEARKIGDVLDLGDAAATDDACPDPPHAALYSPAVIEKGSLFSKLVPV